MSTTYINKNAELNLYDANGKLQLHKDREAARAYFIEHVNVHTRFFHDLEEKIDYLTKNDYWDANTINQYSPTFVKKAFKQAYDHKFRFPSFMGAYKFYTSYALRSNDGKEILERYEDRVVMCSLYLAQGDTRLASNLIDEIIAGRYQPATPTFQNSGKSRGGERVSCFLLRTEDSLDSIKDTWNYAAQLSKAGGGVALNLTNIREEGAPLKGKSGLAKGIVPWMKILEDIFSTVDQLGTRQGAGAVYLSAHHPDILKFLDTKRENADEKIRIKTLSTGVVIPDITFDLARNGEDMYLFSPYDVKKAYGVDFSDINITEKYREMVNNPAISKKKINPRKLLTTIAELQMESGYPYMLFVDTANKANAVDGTIQMSNLCVTGDTQILTDKGYRTALDLYNSQEDFDVVVDTRARDFDLNNLGTSVEKSTRMFKTAEQTDVYTLRTAEGHTITATPWHKFYVVRGSDLIKIPLVEVEVGDKILVQSEESASYGNVDEPALSYLAGAIAADGTFVTSETSAGNTTNTARLYLYDDKDEFASDLEYAAALALKEYNNLLERQSTLTPEFTGNAYNRIALHSAPLAKRFASLGWTQKLSVPEFVLQGTKETQQAFINGVFQLDGTITGTVKTGSASIELGSVNREFLQGIQRLLLNLGVYTRIYKGRNAEDTTWADGNTYHSEQMWSLRTSLRKDVDTLYSLVTWKKAHRERWETLTANRSAKANYNTHKHLATVASVEFSGVEDVYDVTVANGNSVIFNGIATGNCSEILQTSAPSVYDEESGEMTEIGRDISCNLGSMNVYDAMKSPDFAKTVDTAMRALTAVSDMTNIQRVPTVKKANDLMHSVGLGQMSLATFFATNEMYYGDEESLDFTNIYFMTVNYYSLISSNKIARERHETFFEFEKSAYADGSYFDQYVNDGGIKPQTAKVRKIFKDAGIQVPTAEDWEALKEKVMKTGLYHAWRLAVPPTGSISYINNASASIHPITALVEIRKEGAIGRVYYPTPHLSDENMKYFEDAYQVGPDKLIDVYAEATKHTDQGLSCTLFFVENATTRDLNKAQIKAWKKGLKTLYYIRLRAVQLAGTEDEGCVSCAL